MAPPHLRNGPQEVFFRLGCLYRQMQKYERAFFCLNKAVTDGALTAAIPMENPYCSCKLTRP